MDAEGRRRRRVGRADSAEQTGRRVPVDAALGAGRHVVTAQGACRPARTSSSPADEGQRGLVLAYEGGGGGGIPIIKALSEGLAGKRIAAPVFGILERHLQTSS